LWFGFFVVVVSGTGYPCPSPRCSSTSFAYEKEKKKRKERNYVVPSQVSLLDSTWRISDESRHLAAAFTTPPLVFRGTISFSSNFMK
jgi:hypothetical protein